MTVVTHRCKLLFITESIMNEMRWKDQKSKKYVQIEVVPLNSCTSHQVYFAHSLFKASRVAMGECEALTGLMVQQHLFKKKKDFQLNGRPSCT
jgi:hypothetical protein